MARESVFTFEATPIKFGPGAADDAGWELRRLGVSRALLVADPRRRICRGSVAGRRDRRWCVFDGSRVEPTLDSLQAAADFALDAGVDGFVSVGGGSSIDTAKVADLIVSHPAPVMDYVNAPIGGGMKPVPGRCCRTSRSRRRAGRGPRRPRSRCWTSPTRRVKTGISHRYLRPSQAIVDPALAASLPAEVSPRRGWTSSATPRSRSCRCRTRRARRPSSPTTGRPIRARIRWRTCGRRRRWSTAVASCVRAVAGADVEARGAMMLAASMAGVGFGSAGVHIPHACAYPIAGLKHVYEPPGYVSDHPFVPHGISVIVTAPAAFRFTYSASPSRHERRRRLLGSSETGPDALPNALLALMADLGVPSLRDLGLRRGRHPGSGRGRAGTSSGCWSAHRARSRADDLASILRESLHS